MYMYVQYVSNRKVVPNTELCIALCSVLGMLIVGHELMRSESHSSCVSVCIPEGHTSKVMRVAATLF